MEMSKNKLAELLADCQYHKQNRTCIKSCERCDKGYLIKYEMAKLSPDEMCEVSEKANMKLHQKVNAGVRKTQKADFWYNHDGLGSILSILGMIVFMVLSLGLIFFPFLI